MQNSSAEEEKGYGGMELLNPQKKKILEALTQAIRKEAGELVYFLNRKDNNSEQYARYARELIQIEATQGDIQRKERLENKIKYIHQTQHDILISIQPMYNQLFDQIANEIEPGTWFNNKLKKLVWLDFILGESDISSAHDSSRENYRLETLSFGSDQRFQKKLEESAKKKKNTPPKIIPPKDHKLMTMETTKQNSENIISSMEKYIHYYGNLFSIDIQDKKKLGQLLERYFVYIFVQALIDTKIMFNMRPKGKNKDEDTTREDSLDHILLYFEGVIDQKINITPTQIKKRMLSNLYSKDNPIDLAYTHTTSQDLLLWEKYLNDTYFSQTSMSVQTASIEILKQYNAQEGISDKVWEVLNPQYHIYKDKIENYQKHKDILQHYQQSTNSQDPYIQEVIQDIEQKISFAQDKKQQHTIFEEDKIIRSIYEDSLPKIRGKFMKTHQVSLQHRHLFDVVISKFLDFYGTKKRVIDAAETENEVLLQILIDSNRTNADYIRFLKQYKTKNRIDELCDQKRSQKMTDKKNKIIEKIWPSQGVLDI